MDPTVTVMTLYLAAVLAIGIWAARRSRGTGGFYVANRDLPWPVVACTMAATTIGGSATVVVAGLAYSTGLPAFNMELFAGMGMIALAIFLAARVRAMGVCSLPEMAERFFGGRFRTLAAIVVLVTEVAWISLLMQATMLVLVVAAGVDPVPALILSCGVFVAYTLIGGQYAVSYSDVLQMGIMVAGVLFLALPAALLSGPGLPNDRLVFPTGPGMNWVQVCSLFFLMFLPHLVGPDIYSKVLSSRTGRDAALGAAAAGAIRIVFGLAVVLLGIAASTRIPDLEVPAMALPAIITEVLPPYLGALVLAALVAAMMSSADTCLLTASTVAAHDIVAPATGIGERNEVLVSRISVVVIGGLSLLLALVLNDVLRTLILAYTVFTAGMILPLLAGLYRDRTGVGPVAASAGLICGSGASLYWMFLVSSAIDPILVGTGACLGAMIVAALIERVVKK